MRRLVIPMMLYLSAAMLAAASYDDIVRTALSDSPDAVAAELSHEAGLLSVLEAELDDAYGFSVTMAASPLSDGMSAIDVSSLSFSMTAPDDDTSFTASIPFGVRYDGQGGSISPSASVEHVFDWGHDDEDLKDMQAAALRISVLREYLADRAAIRRNVLSLVTELLENERSAMEASLELDDASRELRDAVSLGIVTEGSIGFLELELARQRAEDSLRICGEEKEELMARYEAYLGAGWDGIEDIPMPVFPDVSGATTSSLLEEADMQRRIAEEEVLVTESAYNPMRMTAGAEAGGSIPLGQGLFSDASLNGRSASLYGSIGWEGNDVSVSAQGGSLNDFVVSVKENDCEKVVSPIRSVDFAMTVSGDSMAPEYPNGSRIFVKKINEKAFIEWGKVYVLDTCNGTIIKILAPSEKDNCVRCVSINPDPLYAPFDVAMNDIYGVYKVLLCMSIK